MLPAETRRFHRKQKAFMIEQEDNNLSSLIEHTSPDDRKSWCDYWQTQNYPWRTEAEIDDERKEFLAKCRSVKPDIKQGTYPFKNVQLSRADIEWLLATHEHGRGPVDWYDPGQRTRRG